MIKPGLYLVFADAAAKRSASDFFQLSLSDDKQFVALIIINENHT